MFAAAHPSRSPRPGLHQVDDERRRVRIGFALSHPTVVAGVALGADSVTGLVGVALLALHALVELHWQVDDRRVQASGIPAAAVYSGPS